MLDEPEREPIWSVPKGTLRVFLFLFSLQILVAMAFIPLGAHPLAIWTALSPVIISAAALSLIAIETGGVIMVLAEGIREWRKKREQKRTADVVRKVVEEIKESARVGPEELDEALRRINERFKCHECSGTGLKDGKPCLGCGGIGGFPTKAIIRGRP